MFNIDIVIIGSSNSPSKYLAFTARKIFSRYPAVRLVLTVSFIFLSSLSKFQSLIREGLKISFRPRLPKKPRVNCVKKPWNKIIPYKFYAAKVLDSISTGLKIPEGQTKKQVCSTLYPVCTPVSVIKKIAFFQKVWYDCGTHKKAKEKLLNFQRFHVKN